MTSLLSVVSADVNVNDVELAAVVAYFIVTVLLFKIVDTLDEIRDLLRKERKP